MPLSAIGFSPAMLDLILGGAVALSLFVYLVWALVRPEDF
ncbi:MAG TPA: K(+)-transporting ATPase subunit F [Acetobacteraceae bacterium]|jgi:K+-transporting ATPase KdpF subunit|nr:K(+)-transporting ATPase subunit F [Acetobacteraceae bacterium]